MSIFNGYIVPDVWRDNLQFGITEKAKMMSLGAIYKDPNPSFKNKGVFEYIPFSKEPEPGFETPQKNSMLPAVEIEQGMDSLICITRQKSFRFSDTVIRRSGEDFFQNMYNNTEDWLARTYEKYLMGILKAIFGPGGTCYSSHSIEETTPLTFDTVFNGKHKLGDFSSVLAMSVYHSDITNTLRKKGMVDTMNIPNWKENQINNGTIDRVAGIPIIESDLLTTINVNGTKKYFTYLLGNNSIYFANPFMKISTQQDDRMNAGDHYLTLTTDFCFHVPGVKYKLVENNRPIIEPTDAQLFDKDSWEYVADNHKKIHIVALITPAEGIPIMPTNPIPFMTKPIPETTSINLETPPSIQTTP